MSLWNFHPPVPLLFSSSQEGIQLFDRIWIRSTEVSVRRLCDVVPQHLPLLTASAAVPPPDDSGPRNGCLEHCGGGRIIIRGDILIEMIFGREHSVLDYTHDGTSMGI